MAIQLDIPHGGWIPKGRITEDGVLPDKYRLQEMPTESYQKRTEKNILEADGTLIVSRGKLTGGSELSKNIAEKTQPPASSYRSEYDDRIRCRSKDQRLAEAVSHRSPERSGAPRQ